MAQASFGYFGIGRETTAGTSVAPTQFLPVKDVDFPVEKNFIEVREIGLSRQRVANFNGAVRPSASFTSSFYPAGAMGTILRGLLGGVTTTAAGGSSTAKLHTFSDADVLPSLSFERSDTRTTGSGNLHERVAGCKIESFGVTAAYDEDVEVSIAAQGLSFPEKPNTKPGSFPFPAMEPFIFTGASVSIDGTPNNLFKTLDFEISNTLERQESLRGTNTAYKLYEGGLMVTLSGTLIFDDTVLYEKFRTSSDMTLTANFVSRVGQYADSTSGSEVPYSARFHFPKIQVSSLGLPMTAGEVMEADVEFQVSYDFTTGKMVDVQLVNADASGTYG